MIKGEKDENTQENPSNKQSSHRKLIAFATIPIVVLTIMITFLLSPAGQSFVNSSGISPLPRISIEKIEFHEGDKILMFVRNTGPSDVTIAQADVNDRIHPSAIEPGKVLSRLSDAKVLIPFPWTAGIPYEFGITTSDGTRFGKSIEAAALTPTPNIEQATLFAMLGTYVGIIPILIGLLWYPFIKTMNKSKYDFLLSLTIGLLVFLAIDALLEANKIATNNVADVFNGQVLIILITIISFIALIYGSEKLNQRIDRKFKDAKNDRHSLHMIDSCKSTTTSSSSPGMTSDRYKQQGAEEQRQVTLTKALSISLMISIGIGLHNFGEGLAIGAAVLLGEVALSTFLILGFTIHNTTEGLAIVTPVAKVGKVGIRKILMMGIVAGVPTIAGAWLGGFLYSPIASIIFLSIGAGAIFQVVFSITYWMLNNTTVTISGDDGNRKINLKVINTPIIVGFSLGMSIMYLTSLLVSL
jgi:zinc transporter, ZIP family